MEKNRNGSRSGSRFLLRFLFIVYLYVLLKIILFKYGPVDVGFLWQQLHRALTNPDSLQARLHFANFTPFVSIERNLNRLSNPNDLVNLLGNIALFIPCGIFIQLSEKRSFLRAICYALGISLGLECSQVVFSMGSFDVDDLILNGLGGILGYGFFINVKRITKAVSP